MLGGLNQGNAGATFQTYWKEMPSAFKFLVVTTLGFGILGIFTTLFIIIFADVVTWTVGYFQIWRLLTSFLVDRSIISVIINLYIISMSLPLVEKVYSSVYMMLEIVVQTFLCNLAFVILGEIFVFMSVVSTNLLSYGTMHLLFIFLWQRASLNPEEMTRFCCFPCILPMKYLPWCFFALFMLFNSNLFMMVACLLGYLQHMVLKRSLLQLPMSFYNKLETILPPSVKQSPGFVPIRSVQTMLRTICRQSRPRFEENDHGQAGRNPFENNNEAMNDRVEVMGQGVPIGGSSAPQRADPTDYKSRWLKNLNDQQAQARRVQEAGAKPAQANKTGNLLDMSEDHNETMRSDYPLNEELNEDETEQSIKKKQEKR